MPGKKKSTLKGTSLFVKILIAFSILLLITVGWKGIATYQKIYSPNVSLRGKPNGYIYIRTGSGFSEVMNQLYQNGYIIDRSSFEWLAERKKYTMHIKPGRFKINDLMSNNELINLLRSGQQEPVHLIFNSLRTKELLASKISKQIEADSAEFVDLLNNEIFLKKYDLTPRTVLSVFIPNTYQFFWNTGASEFFDRMYSEYQKFWNDQRVELAIKTGLNRLEISVLASIIEEETFRISERTTVAGVYINRLNKYIPLQADPTIKFALGDFSVRRILKKQLDIDSPYNTYKHRGLPPGPISIPSISSIDAVLNYEHHSFLYFCAKEDFSGYHVFAKTLQQHNSNAARYQKALNQKRIWE